MFYYFYLLFANISICFSAFNILVFLASSYCFGDLAFVLLSLAFSYCFITYGFTFSYQSPLFIFSYSFANISMFGLF